MAELQFPNIVGNFLQGQQLGRQRRAEDAAAANQTRLGELAQMAYSAAPQDRGQFIGQAVGINPEAGLALERSFSQQDDAREQRLLSTARLIAAAPAEQKGAIFQQVRPQIAQYLPNLPETYNEQVGQGINAFIQSRSGAAGGAKVVGNALVDANGNVIYQAPQRFQTDSGLIEVGPQGVRELRVGDSTGQPTYTQESSGRPVMIGADVSPEDRAAILANPDAFGAAPDLGAVNLPPQPAQGQRILPRGAGMEARRLELQEQTAARQEAAANRAADAAERAATAADRQATTETFKNEQALRKEVSDRVKDQRTILSAYEKVRTTAQNPSAANDRALIFSYMKMLDPDSVVREGEFASAQNAAGVPDQIINIYNRVRSGEILNEDQRAQFTASAQNIANKAQESIDNIAGEYRQIAQGSGLDPDRATGLKAPVPRRNGIYAPQTEAEYNRIPKGAIFIDPEDGRRYTKE